MDTRDTDRGVIGGGAAGWWNDDTPPPPPATPDPNRPRTDPFVIVIGFGLLFLVIVILATIHPWG